MAQNKSRVNPRQLLKHLNTKLVGEPSRTRRVVHHVRHPLHWWKNRKLWHRLAAAFLALLLLTIGSMYGIAQWYIHKHQIEPLRLGATFIPSYARYFDLDPESTLQAFFVDLGVKDIRLISYWEDSEPIEGHYDFSDLDWEFKMANDYGVKVSLAIGLRQPRWPECHMPGWAERLSEPEWYPHLKKYMTAVIERYKNNPALDSYQLENEYFLKAFGHCTNFNRSRLVDEFNLVRQLDPHRKLIVSMSNNAIGTPIGQPTPDEWAISVYKRVWDKTITKRYFEYPIPAWYYAFRAGFTELTRHHDSFIHELQAEAWAPNDLGIKDISIAEQNKSLDAQRLKARFGYGRATGMRQIDMWGVEWWYWRKVSLHDDSLWNVAKDEFTKANQEKFN